MRRFPVLATLQTFLLLCGGAALGQCPTTPVIHSGQATYYDFASGAGACSFDTTWSDLMVGAMNVVDYQGSQACGECVSLRGPNGMILIRIVDLCPDCPEGNIDLSPEAFSRIADLSLGKVPITWQVVPCPMKGPVQYHFKDDSNQWWTSLQIRNHRYPILSLEYLTPGGTFAPVSRASYNYFIQSPGMGPGPYTFRVTDVYGHVIVDSGIPDAAGQSVAGGSQFPSCDPDVTSSTVVTKVYLQGPYESAGDTMRATLGASIPRNHPYGGSPWSYTGKDSVTTIPPHVVDWVLVQLRTGTAPSTTVASRAVFLRTNGMVVDLDGVSPVRFTGVPAGNYYIVVRHRNHLAVMSKVPVPLSSAGAMYDFLAGP
ncbi:MAG TPA: expansin EXLX1 family cellulose-binding protein [Bacteroidota bacterium]|nr:expansin EXLX1 family cellulose-binding protein [Bacteroidota bacterium]